MATRSEQSAQREKQCDEVLERWAAQSGIDVGRFDAGQRWVLFAALRMAAVVKGISPLKRVLAYVLAHCGMDLGTKVIGAITGVSDRAVRNTQAEEPEKILHRVRNPIEGHRQPKLAAEHAGVVAKFLVENPGAQVKDVLDFIERKLEITVDRLTLRRFIKRYGLGCLRGDLLTDRPLFSASPSTEAPSS